MVNTKKLTPLAITIRQYMKKDADNCSTPLGSPQAITH